MTYNTKKLDQQKKLLRFQIKHLDPRNNNYKEKVCELLKEYEQACRLFPSEEDKLILEELILVTNKNMN
ncbi:MAG: hypothetical protein HUJ68_11215 [Clostridia bacterium]|nr:hypothetical protein [Clostridia bacterium]